MSFNNNFFSGKECASQALARIGITINPEIAFPGQRSYEVIRPLLSLLHVDKNALQNFEALLALTNLAQLSESVRYVICSFSVYFDDFCPCKSVFWLPSRNGNWSVWNDDTPETVASLHLFMFVLTFLVDRHVRWFLFVCDYQTLRFPVFCKTVYFQSLCSASR